MLLHDSSDNVFMSQETMYYAYRSFYITSGDTVHAQVDEFRNAST